MKKVHRLRFDAVAALLHSGNAAIETFVRRDLLDEKADLKKLWQLPAAEKLIKKQNADGSWNYPGGNVKIRSRENYNQLETYRNLGFLVEQYGMTREYPALARTAEYLFSFQTREGDFRGIYGNQYSPNYTAAIAELLIKAGYRNDPRIHKVFEWLLSIRQDDKGWAIPLRTRKHGLSAISGDSATISPDTSKPFSWLVTGVVLRAFAAHPGYRRKREAQQAGKLLLSSLFQKDSYPDRAGKEYWLRFTFPFWYTDLISALDSLSLLGFSAEEPQIGKALEWFVDQQQKDGLWKLKILKGKNREETERWLALAICRIFRRLGAA